MQTIVRKLLRNQQGAVAVEYGLIVVGIVMAIWVTITLLGVSIKTVFYDVFAGIFS